MVSKPMIVNKPDPVDESWWAAILSEEEKYAPPATNHHNFRETTSDKEASPSRPVQKVSSVDWQRAQALFEQDEPVTLQVSGYNRGGLLVGGEGLHGFVPVSHLVDFDCLAEENQRDDILEGYVGKEISLKVIECE
jgi:ribosomal protein S1